MAGDGNCKTKYQPQRGQKVHLPGILPISRANGAVLFRPINKKRVNGQKIMFLINVSQLDNLMASPKHPQSLTGLNKARNNVSTVKKNSLKEMFPRL
jgi:hypothetical protein